MTEQNSTMKTYPKYKDSNIPWIGKIPCEWNVTRNKNFFTCKKEIVGCNSSVTQLLSLTKKGVVKKDINNTDGKQPESFDTYQYVNKDDIVMCLFDLDCSAVFSGISNFNGMISPAYKVLKCKNIVPRFVDYWFSYVSDGRKFNHYAKNIRYTLNFEDFSALPILIPTIREQQSIAAYLDRKCSAIDRVIKTESRIIEKLKEYRQSLITETVSHGLNPHAPMKASGIPWIDRIPRHWELRKLKNILKLRNEKKEYSGESYIGLENIESHSGKYIPPKEIIVDGISNRFFCGDVIFGKLRPYLAKAAITDFDGLCSSEFLVMKEFKGDRRYLLGILLSYWFIDIVNSSTYGTKMPRASWEFIGNMYVPYPPLSEQISIADFLDSKCSAIDSTISKKQQIIEKMTEYKKSLIYECVTGKISI